MVVSLPAVRKSLLSLLRPPQSYGELGEVLPLTTAFS